MTRLVYKKRIKTLFWNDQDFYQKNHEEITKWCTTIGCYVGSHSFGWIVCPSDNHAAMVIMKYGH